MIMYKKEIMLIALTFIVGLVFAQAEDERSDHNPDRKIKGLKLFVRGNYVGIVKENMLPFEDTLPCLNIKNIRQADKYMEKIADKVIPSSALEKLSRLEQQDTTRALSIYIEMKVMREEQQIQHYLFYMSKEIFDVLTNEEVFTMYDLFGKEQINSGLIEFRILSPEQIQKISHECAGVCGNGNSNNPDPLDVVPINKRRLVEQGILYLPLVKLNMKLPICIFK